MTKFIDYQIIADVMQANESRLRKDIERNAEFGRVNVDKGQARTVFTGTEANRKSRDSLVKRMEDAGLAVRVDRVGNIAGRWTPPSGDPEAAPIASGSHLDSVPEGGIFDGPLGVYAALESVRVLQSSDVDLVRPIEVVCFTEEEGQRFDTLTGSSVASGHRDATELLDKVDTNGTRLKEVLSEIGYSKEGVVDASQWDSWLELHIEQGTRLEENDVSVGVVSDITGITHCEVTISGESNHAGTTPMPDRCDALAAAAEFVLDIERAAVEQVHTTSNTAVGTVGKLNVRPNGTNVVPGQTLLGVDIRDISRKSMETLVRRMQKSLRRLEVERSVGAEFDRYFDIEPTALSERCQKAIRCGGQSAGVETIDLHSGAGHDTMHVATATDAAMLFAPSCNGVSHSPLEWTDWEDCATATTVLTNALAKLAG